MIEITVSPSKILFCLLIALATSFLARLIIGDKRDEHFRRSQIKSLITIRGKLGDSMALGFPKTWWGLGVWLLLVVTIILECALVMIFF